MGEALLRTLFATLPWVECVLCLVPPFAQPYTPVKEMFDEMGRAQATVDTREDVNVRNSIIFAFGDLFLTACGWSYIISCSYSRS